MNTMAESDNQSASDDPNLVQYISCGDLGLEIKLDVDIEEEIELEWDFYLPLSVDGDLEWNDFKIEDLVKSSEKYKYEFRDRIPSDIKTVCLSLNAKENTHVIENSNSPLGLPYDSSRKCKTFCVNDDDLNDQNYANFPLSDTTELIVQHTCSTKQNTLENELIPKNCDSLIPNRDDFKIVVDKKNNDCLKVNVNKPHYVTDGEDVIAFSLSWLDGRLIYDANDPGEKLNVDNDNKEHFEIIDLSIDKQLENETEDGNVDYNCCMTNVKNSISKSTSSLSFISAASSNSDDETGVYHSVQISSKVLPHQSTKLYTLNFVRADEFRENPETIADNAIGSPREKYDNYASKLTQTIVDEALITLQDKKRENTIDKFVNGIFSSISPYKDRTSRQSNSNPELTFGISDPFLVDLNAEDTISEVSLGKDMPVITSSVDIISPDEIMDAEQYSAGQNKDINSTEGTVSPADEVVNNYWLKSVVRKEGEGGTTIFFRTVVPQSDTPTKSIKYIDGISAEITQMETSSLDAHEAITDNIVEICIEPDEYGNTYDINSEGIYQTVEEAVQIFENLPKSPLEQISQFNESVLVTAEWNPIDKLSRHSNLKMDSILEDEGENDTDVNDGIVRTSSTPLTENPDNRETATAKHIFYNGSDFKLSYDEPMSTGSSDVEITCIDSGTIEIPECDLNNNVVIHEANQPKLPIIVKQIGATFEKLSQGIEEIPTLSYKVDKTGDNDMRSPDGSHGSGFCEYEWQYTVSEPCDDHVINEGNFSEKLSEYNSGSNSKLSTENTAEYIDKAAGAECDTGICCTDDLVPVDLINLESDLYSIDKPCSRFIDSKNTEIQNHSELHAIEKELEQQILDEDIIDGLTIIKSDYSSEESFHTANSSVSDNNFCYTTGNTKNLSTKNNDLILKKKSPVNNSKLSRKFSESRKSHAKHSNKTSNTKMVSSVTQIFKGTKNKGAKCRHMASVTQVFTDDKRRKRDNNYSRNMFHFSKVWKTKDEQS